MIIKHAPSEGTTLQRPTSNRRLLTPALLALALGACGGGGSGSAVSPGAGESSDTPNTPGALVIGGSVGDGPVVGATITARDAAGKAIATTKSDEQAKYRLTLPESTQFPLYIQAEGGLDLVSNAAPDFAMRAVVMEAGERFAHLSPFSTVIASTAAAIPGGLSAANLAAAKSAVLRYLNFGWDLEAVPNPVHSPIAPDDAAAVVKASEALAEALRRAATQLQAAQPDLTVEAVLEAIGADIADGAIDGIGGSATPRIAATWHATAAQVLAESLVNRLRVGNEVATGRLDAALRTAFPGGARTLADVTITEQMLDQTQVALLATHNLIPNAALPELDAVRAQLPDRPRAADLAKILPADLSDQLAPAAALAVNGTDTALAQVNQIARAAAKADGTYGGYTYDRTYALRLSTSSSRAEATLLQGQVLKGAAFVFTDPTLKATRVDFYLNDPFMAGEPVQIESLGPYDFAGTDTDGGAAPYDTTGLADGTHTISALIALADGSRQLSHASFVVNNVDHWSSALQLAWNPVPEGATGYQVLYGNAPEGVNTLLFDLPVGSGLIDAAAPVVSIDPVYDLGIRDSYGTPVCFSVRAYNATGISDAAEPVCSTI